MDKALTVKQIHAGGGATSPGPLGVDRKAVARDLRENRGLRENRELAGGPPAKLPPVIPPP